MHEDKYYQNDFLKPMARIPIHYEGECKMVHHFEKSLTVSQNVKHTVTI